MITFRSKQDGRGLPTRPLQVVGGDMEDEEPDDDQIEVVIGCASVVLALWGLAAIAAFVLFVIGWVRLF